MRPPGSVVRPLDQRALRREKPCRLQCAGSWHNACLAIESLPYCHGEQDIAAGPRVDSTAPELLPVTDWWGRRVLAR